MQTRGLAWAVGAAVHTARPWLADRQSGRGPIRYSSTRDHHADVNASEYPTQPTYAQAKRQTANGLD